MAARINDCESRIAFVLDEFWPDVCSILENTCVKEAVVVPILSSSPFRFVPKRHKRTLGNPTRWKGFLKRHKETGVVEDIPYEEDLPLVIVYSSGSTGAAKGILLSQDSFQNSVHAYSRIGIEMSYGKKLYQIIPPWFSTGLSTSLHLPLSFGATVFMDPRFDRKIFVKNILHAKPNYTIGPTTVYEGFITEEIPAKADFSFLEAPFEGGEALLPSIAQDIDDVLLSHGSSSSLLTGYGQCECGATVTTMIKGATHPKGSVGVPLPGVTVAIVDDGFQEMPIGERGHIVVNTPCGMLRYFKAPEATDAFFYKDADGAQWSRTGDIGYMDADGNLFVEGCVSDVVVVDGVERYAFDIENAFMESESFQLVDLLESVSLENDEDDGNPVFIARIILSDAGRRLGNEDLRKSFRTARRSVEVQLGLSPSSIRHFKVWDTFPQAKSGKRDIESMKADANGIVHVA